MANNRKAATEYILKYVDAILPGSPNTAHWEKTLNGMTDAEFRQFMQDLRDDKVTLSLEVPNLGKYRLSTKRNLDLAKELGYEFFNRIKFGPSEDRPGYITPIKYLVLTLPIRRQAQHLLKKISIPKDNNSVDIFTGQPTGKSQGSKMSYPEGLVMLSNGLEKSMVEVMKYRGGDRGGFNALNDSIIKTGIARLDAVAPNATGVESTATLKTFLTCMHLKTEI